MMTTGLVCAAVVLNFVAAVLLVSALRTGTRPGIDRAMDLFAAVLSCAGIAAVVGVLVRGY